MTNLMHNELIWMLLQWKTKSKTNSSNYNNNIIKGGEKPNKQMKEKRFYDMVISQVDIGNLKSQKGTYPIYLINVQTVEISLCRNH